MLRRGEGKAGNKLSIIHTKGIRYPWMLTSRMASRSTSRLILGRLLINTKCWSSLDQQLVDSHINVSSYMYATLMRQQTSWATVDHLLLSFKCWASIKWGVDTVPIKNDQVIGSKVSIEGIDQRYWSRVSIDGINWHSLPHLYMIPNKQEILTDLEEIFINSDGILCIFQSLVISSQHHKGSWAIPIISSYCRG